MCINEPPCDEKTIQRTQCDCCIHFLKLILRIRIIGVLIIVMHVFNFRVQRSEITTKLVYSELENNLKQGPAPPWGVELVTSPMLKESSHKFPQAKRPDHGDYS